MYDYFSFTFGDYNRSFFGGALNWDLLYDGKDTVYLPQVECVEITGTSRCSPTPRRYYKVRLDEQAFEVTDAQLFIEAGVRINYSLQTVGAVGNISWTKSTVPAGSPKFDFQRTVEKGS